MRISPSTSPEPHHRLDAYILACASLHDPCLMNADQRASHGMPDDQRLSSSDMHTRMSGASAIAPVIDDDDHLTSTMSSSQRARARRVLQRRIVESWHDGHTDVHTVADQCGCSPADAASCRDMPLKPHYMERPDAVRNTVFCLWYEARGHRLPVTNHVHIMASPACIHAWSTIWSSWLPRQQRLWKRCYDAHRTGTHRS
jgi:hypothetical protein